jgi:hypothetical protein
MSPAPNRSRRHGGCESTWHGTAVVSSGEVCGECGHSVLESIAHAKWHGDIMARNIRMGCSLRGHPGSSPPLTVAQVCTLGRSKTSVASCMSARSTTSTKKWRTISTKLYTKDEGVLWTVIHSSYLDPKNSSIKRCSRKTNTKSVNIESGNFRGPNHLNSQVISRSQFLIAKTSTKWMKEVHRLRLTALPA